jgi:hypothetical protein
MAVLSSCGGKMSPYSYNEKIVAMHIKASDFLNKRMETIFEHEISKEIALKVVDSLKTSYDGYINELKSLKIPDAATDWNNVTIQLYEYLKDNVIPLFGESLSFEPESDEWYNVWNEIDSRLNGKASQIEDEMIREQEKFAAAVDIKFR